MIMDASTQIYRYETNNKQFAFPLRNAAQRGRGKEIQMLSSDGGMGTLFCLATGKILQLNICKEIVPATGQKIQAQGWSFVF